MELQFHPDKRTPDDGQRESPKRVEFYKIINLDN
jgi:hypothetical protein